MNPREGVTEYLVINDHGVSGATADARDSRDTWHVRDGSQLADRLHRLAAPVVFGSYRVRIDHAGDPGPYVFIGRWPRRGALVYERASTGVRAAVMRWYAGALQRSKAEHTNRAGLVDHLAGADGTLPQ